MRKIISKILTATFIVCFAYIGSTIEFKDDKSVSDNYKVDIDFNSPKNKSPISESDKPKKDSPVLAKQRNKSTMSENSASDFITPTPPVEPTPPPPKPVEVEFYKEPKFYLQSTVGGVFGYILKHVLDFITAGIKLVIGKMS